MFKLGTRLSAFYRSVPGPLRNLVASVYAAWSARLKYGGRYTHWRTFLNESQWWTPDQIRDYQARQIEELLRFVFEECPFYHDLMVQRGIPTTGSDPFAALARFPILDRNVVKAEHDRIKTRFATDPKLVLSTSGTTGASLHVPMTDETMQREYGFRWHYYSVAKAKRGDRFAFFQGHMVVPVARRKPPFYIRNYAENTMMFSLYHMDEASLGHYAQAFNAFSPRFVYGYPSGIFVLAFWAKKHGVKLHAPEAVFTASEMLHDFQQQLIQEVFQAEIFQWYGQVETTANLQECERHRLHVKEEYGLLELLNPQGDPAKPGELANAIATGWGNRAFPLLRYHTGDQMVLSTESRCPCGRAGRIVDCIAGRDDDFLITPDGTHVGRLDFVFKAVDTVRESQIVQDDAESVTMRVVPLPGFSDKDKQILINQLRDRIGNSMRIRIEIVDQIPRGPSGKFRYVLSRVPGGLLP